jgi:hypothetical protein
LLIATCATAYIYYRSRRKAKRDPLEHHPISASLAQQRAVERQMSNLLIELSDMARTVSASLDTRTAKLEALLDDADQRIETLRAMNAPHSLTALAPPSSQSSSFELARTTRSDDSPAPQSTTDERHLRVYELHERGQSIQQIAEALTRPSGEIELILALRSREGIAKAS